MTMHVIVARFSDYETAAGAVTLVTDAGIKLEDHAIVTNNGSGDLEFREGKDAGGGKGFVYGSVLTGAAGLLLGPIGWGAVAAGGIAGGLVAKLHDAGIPSSKLEDVGRALKVGEGAAIAVTKDGDEGQVSRIFESVGGSVEAVGITDDLKSALDELAPTGITVSKDGQASSA